MENEFDKEFDTNEQYEGNTESKEETALGEEKLSSEEVQNTTATPETIPDQTAEETVTKQAEEQVTQEPLKMDHKNQNDEFERVLDEVFSKPQETKKKENDYYSKIQVQPKKDHGYLSGALKLALVFGVATGGGYLGATLANKNNPAASVIHEVEYVQPSAQNVSYTTPANSIETVVENYSDTVVEITTEKTVNNWFMQQYVVSGAGSGVIVTEDGYIVTCNHVIRDARNITVRTTDGTEYPARVIGTYPESDSAIIKVDAKNLHAVTLGSSDDLKVGQSIIAIGNPLGSLGGSVTTGIVSAKERTITVDEQSMTLLQISAPISPGNSGGALLNLNGELVGIVNAKTIDEDVEGIGFAIPMSDVKTAINELVSQGYVTGKRMMGIRYANVTDSRAAEYYGLPSDTKQGIYIVEVTADSLAEELGIQKGDRLVSINGNTIDSMEVVSQNYTDLKAGTPVTLVVERDGQMITFEFTRD